MKVTTNFQRIESIEFQFDEVDLQNILINYLKRERGHLLHLDMKGEWAFDWYDTEDGRIKVELKYTISRELEPAIGQEMDGTVVEARV